jgi:hypothetical protein
MRTTRTSSRGIVEAAMRKQRKDASEKRGFVLKVRYVPRYTILSSRGHGFYSDAAIHYVVYRRMPGPLVSPRFFIPVCSLSLSLSVSLMKKPIVIKNMFSKCLSC